MNSAVIDLLAVSVCSTAVFLILMAAFKMADRFMSETGKYYLELAAIMMFLVPFYRLAAFILERCPGSGPDMKFEFFTMPVNAVASGQVAGSGDANPLFFIWLTGFLLVLGCQSLRYFKCCRLLRKDITVPAEKSVLEIYERLCADLNLKKAPEVCGSSYVKAPVLLWCFGYKVLLPLGAVLTDKSMELVLRHELTHYARKDLWYKYLLNVVAAIHWFNPFMHLLKREHGKRCELSCDEQVIKKLSGADRIRYGDLILGMCGCAQAKTAAGLSFSSKEKDILKGRILLLAERKGENVLKKKIVTRTIVCLMAGFFCLTGVISYAAGTSAREQNNQATEKKAVRQEEPANKGSKKTTELSIAIDKISDMDKIFEDPAVKDKKLVCFYVGSTQDSVVDKVFDKTYDKLKEMKIIVDDVVIWGCPSDLVNENDNYDNKGKIVFTFE